MYAYGVVLLELLTAAEVVDTRRPAACHNLVDWLYSKLHDPAAIQQVRLYWRTHKPVTVACCQTRNAS